MSDEQMNGWGDHHDNITNDELPMTREAAELWNQMVDVNGVVS